MIPLQSYIRMSESEYAAVDFELVQLYRNNTIRVVTVILAFSLIIMVIDVVLFVQTSGTEGAKNIAHTLSIVAVQTHLLRIPSTLCWCSLSGMHSTCIKRRSLRSSDTCKHLGNEAPLLDMCWCWLQPLPNPQQWQTQK